jgi:DDE superfamily endonuclease
LFNFKRRNHIKEYHKLGEAASAPLDDLPIFRKELQYLIAQYELDDVYNADETALYWKLEPNKSLACGPITGTKKPKDRITIMLCCNATGTHKLPPVFINKYKNPYCLRNINRETLPVWYYWNNTAWMQHSIFQKWIKHVNQLMRTQKRHILLLIDNASSHQLEENEELSNIKLHFLPPNTTSHLQPIDQGIIHSFKVIIFLFINLFLKTYFILFILFIYLLGTL